MNREIKFRVWHEGDKKWVDSNSVFHSLIVNLNSEFKLFTSGHYIIQQFTGLLDQNGKGIFEGDIVEYCRDCPIDEDDWNYSKEIGIIEFIESQWGKKLGFEIMNNNRNFYGSWPGNEFVKIIGNIFQNPELLNEQKLTK